MKSQPKPPIKRSTIRAYEVAESLYNELKTNQHSLLRQYYSVCNIMLHDIKEQVADNGFTPEQKSMYEFWIEVGAALHNIHYSKYIGPY